MDSISRLALPRWKRPHLRFGLRFQLVALMLFTLIPFAAEKAWESFDRDNNRIDVELVVSQDVAQATGATFMNYLDSLWNTELAIGSAIAYRLPADQIEPYLRAQLPAHSTIIDFEWLSPNGTILAATSPHFRGRSCADREHVMAILNGEEESVSGLHTLTETSKPVCFVARAIRQGGKLTGIVVAVMDPARLGRVLPPRSGERDLGLIDDHGMEVYRSTSPVLSLNQRKTEATSPAWLCLREERAVVSGVTPYRFAKGQRIGAWVPVLSLGWVAYATTPMDEVLAATRFDTKRDLNVLVVINLLSLTGAILLGNRLLVRARALEHTAEEISRGNLDARVDLKGTDELAIAGQAFDKMVDRIQGLDAERTQFLQIAAHELRNPMAAITGMLSVLLKRVSAGKPLANETSLLQSMRHEVFRLSTLLTEMLDAFRIQEGQVSAGRSPVDFAEVVKSAVQPFVAMDGPHAFVLAGVDRKVTVLGDARQLEDLVRNLVSNAVKYAPAGGPIEVTLITEGGRALLSVSDEGLGIPEDELPRVFERFYRATNLAGRDPGGMGLGLYICKDTVERHGGRIWAVSDPGRGTTFYVEIPLAEGKGE